jgi:hypothetical protein
MNKDLIPPFCIICVAFAYGIYQNYINIPPIPPEPTHEEWMQTLIAKEAVYVGGHGDWYYAIYSDHHRVKIDKSEFDRLTILDVSTHR